MCGPAAECEFSCGALSVIRRVLRLRRFAAPLRMTWAPLRMTWHGAALSVTWRGAALSVTRAT